jgi:hypothetical protein
LQRVSQTLEQHLSESIYISEIRRCEEGDYKISIRIYIREG